MFKLFSVLALSLVVFCGCGQGNSKELYKNAPRGEMPTVIAPATWRYGTISALGYYNKNGDRLANAQETMREYKVGKDGMVEFAQLLVIPVGSCINKTFTHLKGTFKYEAPNKLLFTPVEGTFSKDFPCSSGASTRKATEADFKNFGKTFYYKITRPLSDQTEYIDLYTDPSMKEEHKNFSYRIIKE